MDLKQLLQQQNTTIVDVREPYEFEELHLDGAVNIPLSVLPLKVEEFRQMSRPIVLYCRTGNRSGQAVNFLTASGIEEVYNGGGLEDLFQLQNGIA
ncbi:MAG: rhodanese-like domain-containing protein [Bacteroidetes bacterium]|nr:MAG: rhodanese-like domain-containing protein [Bacteroidota bacterium]